MSRRKPSLASIIGRPPTTDELDALTKAAALAPRDPIGRIYADTPFDIRFWGRTLVQPESGCWEWQGARFQHGYGSVFYNRRTWCSHRLSYTLVKGVIPDSMLVCHRCDNPPCINPEHLFVGTALDNTLDAEIKGRRHHPVGPEHPNWRRDATTESMLLELKAAGFGLKRSSKATGWSTTSIRNILNQALAKQVVNE